MLDKSILKKLYFKKDKSMQEIADILGCSLHKVSYWMGKHNLNTRSRSDAVYLKHNPNGNPFKFIYPRTQEDAKLMGIGLGLYWGEGTKADRSSVRLGNSDPNLIKKFIEFLEKIYGIKKADLKFSLQIFTDTSPKNALNYWFKNLNVNESQFYKTTITPPRGKGTYKNKLENGVLIVYYHNTRLRRLIISHLEDLFKNKPM